MAADNSMAQTAKVSLGNVQYIVLLQPRSTCKR
jgi:hypothetical protein